jgi:hypothetical protein
MVLSRHPRRIHYLVLKTKHEIRSPFISLFLRGMKDGENLDRQCQRGLLAASSLFMTFYFYVCFSLCAANLSKSKVPMNGPAFSLF